ncbi:uncharacterized protein LOC127836458 [Dreissena polymorpha]|uniref:C1q domain-containing protein n=1 Tax=Dreissena polymorpha TaxID=45954 RepID=A0A9D4G766_DREPO|nr:uncharacterized protein LOC127836458 [Dreissena polymorpha]KAH3810086.1 hypothetical protein DPMN_138472 [Dreissena polymorpha]
MWFVILLVYMLKASSAVEPSCQVCSKFDYERLLERVIRNELTLKDTLDKITKTNAKVEETLKRIETENAKLNLAMQGLEEKKRTIDDKIDALVDTGAKNMSEAVAEMKTAVQSLVKQTAQEWDVMKENSSVPHVMFHARQTTTGQRSYTTNQDVVFPTVLINDGGWYSPITGHFTASVAGVYMFMVQFCPYLHKWAYLEIVHAGRALQSSGHKGEDVIVCVSMQAFAKVAIGDEVWVRISATSEIYHDDTRSTSYAGLLISL